MTFAPAPVLMDIALDRIDTTGGTQMRVRIDDATVLEYRERMAAGDEFPPVVVYREGAKHWLADGFHRFRARINIGARDIRAEVHVGDRLDAIAHAIGANRSNGLRRTNADKQMAVRAALSLERFAEMSDRAIADIIGVDGKTVAAMRTAELPQLPATSQKRTGLDGKARHVAAPKTVAPRVAARGAEPRRDSPASVPRAVASVNTEDGPRVAAPSVQRAVLRAGEEIACPHCHGTGRIRGAAT